MLLNTMAWPVVMVAFWPAAVSKFPPRHVPRMNMTEGPWLLESRCFSDTALTLTCIDVQLRLVTYLYKRMFNLITRS